MAVFDEQIKKHKADKWTLITQARSIVTKAEGEKRALTSEERQEVDRMQTAIDEHEQRISDMEKLNEEPEEGEREDVVETDEGEGHAPADAGAGADRSRPHGGEQRRGQARTAQTRTQASETRRHASKEYRKAFGDWLRTGEFRDVTVGTATAGGNLVAPVQMSQDIVKQIDNLVFVRKLARIDRVERAQALGVRQMTNRASAASWTTEIGSLTADSAMAFGRRDLTPHLLTKLALISLQMLEVMPEVEPFVDEELSYQFAVAEENAYMTGTGSGQPLGVFTASANGIPTAQDYGGTNTTTALTADTIVSARYQIKQPYLQGDKVAWAWSRAAVQQIRLLKDAQNRYLLVDGGGMASAPDTICGIPYFVSEYVPNTFTTGLYVGILGNWSYYRIAELKDLYIQRLIELYAGTNEIGFAGRRWFDGAPVLGEAFVRIKLN